MENHETTDQKYNFVCFRCGCIIKTGEKMVNLSVTVETPTEDDTLQVAEATTVSTLCQGCAAVLLSQAITRDSSLMMPPPHKSRGEDDEGEEEYEDEFICSEGDDDEPAGRLAIRYSRKGFLLALDCGDGVSKATSQFFSWKQIIQMLIAMDPDMFGVISEPLHRVFPRALSCLGYHVPGWA